MFGWSFLIYVGIGVLNYVHFAVRGNALFPRYKVEGLFEMAFFVLLWLGQLFFFVGVQLGNFWAWLGEKVAG